MTEINGFGSSYRGTSRGDHGVFTNSDFEVYAGKFLNRSACVGVFTFTSGSKYFVECDADGQVHGRELDCTADGDTVYLRHEHGRRREHAVLRADGTCYYNGEACLADFAPFVALQAMVVPIKARPPTSAPTAAFVPHSLPSPPIRSIGHCFGICRNWQRPTPTGCAPNSAISLHGRATQPMAPAQKVHRASNLDDAPGRKGELCMRHKPHA